MLFGNDLAENAASNAEVSGDAGNRRPKPDGRRRSHVTSKQRHVTLFTTLGRLRHRLRERLPAILGVERNSLMRKITKKTLKKKNRYSEQIHG